MADVRDRLGVAGTASSADFSGKLFANGGIFFCRFCELPEKNIVLLDNDNLMHPYLEFYLRTPGSANEARPAGLGRLYIERGPELLELVRVRSVSEKEEFSRGVAGGVASLLYPYLTEENFKRRIVGAHWELLRPDHPDHELVRAIELEVLNRIRRQFPLRTLRR